MRTDWTSHVLHECVRRDLEFSVVNFLVNRPPPDGLPLQPLASWAAALFAELTKAQGGAAPRGSVKGKQGRRA
jgi:hypothetical protein